MPLYGGGPVRIFAIVDHLREQGFRVDVVARDHGRRLNRQIRRRFDRVWILWGPEGGVWGPGRWTRFRRRLTSRIPWKFKRPLRRKVPARLRADSEPAPRQTSYILRKIDPRLCHLAGEAARTSRHDAVISEFAWTARALDEVPEGTLRIIDTHDIQHLRHPNAEAAGRSLPHHRCTREEEVRELERADVLLAIQAEEAETLKGLCPGKQVVIAEHALAAPHLLASPESSKTILFVGNLYDPNLSGLTAFLKNSWPGIRASVPGSELLVCGRICEAFESTIPGVKFLGVVPELNGFYERAAVVINPATYGSGLNIKSVEALSLGKCVVGTSSAFRGISPGERPPFIEVSTDDEMTQSVISLLEDPKLRSDMEHRTHAFAKKYLAPELIYSDLARLVEEHVRASRERS